MDSEVISGLLQAIRDAVTATRQKDDDIALPMFDPEHNDCGAASWCNSVGALAKELNWSSIRTAAKADVQSVRFGRREFIETEVITMPPVTLEGDTLGQKRQHFNKLVQDAIANKHYELCNISGDDSDIDNLLKIDIASKNRNVEFIIEVMKSNDMLYAATAIKKSTWLITEQQYANIINPEYLHTQLLPSMNTKMFNKLMLHIRLNLKDESRVEAFYEYLKSTNNSYKWLQNCSIPFIENVIKNERLIPLSLFKRLCKRSPNFIACHKRVIEGRVRHNTAKQEILYYMKSHTEQILDALEQDDLYYYRSPNLGKKKTEFLMKTYSQKIFDNIIKYVYLLDLSVAVKYMNKKDIKSFLKKQVTNKSECLYYLFAYNTLGHFIRNMSEDERFEFVSKTFINKTELAEFYPEFEKNHSHIKTYQWYEFAPFNVALPELQKLIHKETSSSERCAMLSVLITCAGRNPQHIKTLLKFVKDKHINEPFKFKIEFVNNLLSHISTLEIDVETWNVLDHLFHSMELYTNSENNGDVQMCLESIILYKVLHDEPVPEILEQKMTFNTFEEVRSKLNQEQKSKMFTYLFNSVLTKLQIENIANESDFSETILHLKNALILVRDWNKDITKYPFLLDKIRELNKIKQENMWKTDMSCLYNMKKSWRKHMFVESLSLCLSEEVCLNALKHQPQLLTRHDKEIDTLRTNDAVSLRRLLAKLRVYWPHSFSQHWIDAYLLHLNKATGQKAVIKGLFSLLPQNKIIDIAKQHIPDNTKVNWGDTDQNAINIKKNIAKHFHVARPLVPLDTVLWYAKGDYLQHTVPSLNAILPNLSVAESRKYLPKLLDAPVSLQKFGLNLAVSKLSSEDLKAILSKLWKTSKNLTIRSVLFRHTYDQICKAHEPTVQKEFWEILSSFIENLTAGENEAIYKLFYNVLTVPISIRAEFYMKSYEFLTSLPASANCEHYVKHFIVYAPNIMEILDEDFVANKILSPAETKFCSYGSEVLEVFACYVLCGKTEEDQLQRYRRVVEPAMDKAFQLWDTTRSGDYYVRDNINKFLHSLVWNFRIYFLSFNEKAVPVKLFVEIKTKMEKELPLLQNYVLYTSWKLVTEYITVINEHKSMFVLNKFELNNFVHRWMSHDMECAWKHIQIKISPTLGPMFVKRLKEDTEQHNFSTIYCLFTEAFDKMFSELLKFQYDEAVLETLQHMLNDDFIQSYFVVSNLTVKYSSFWSSCRPMRSQIRKILESHPSKAVQMHYFNDFRIIAEVTEAGDD